MAGDTNAAEDVFVYDRATAGDERVSVASDGTQGDRGSFSAAISSDGRYIAFASSSTNLVAGDTNGFADVFVRDRQAGTTTRVSVSSGGGQSNGSSAYNRIAISGDGRYVVFESNATNLVADKTTTFRYDQESGTLDLVSVNRFGGGAGNGDSFHPALSADGRYVAFWSWASNLVASDVNLEADVFVRDLAVASTALASQSTLGDTGDDLSEMPSISASGRHVTFSSNATNLVANDGNLKRDIFRRDLAAFTTVRLSVDSAGAEANSNSDFPSVSADGSVVAFESDATNLVAGDTDLKRDVFVREEAADNADFGAAYPYSRGAAAPYAAFGRDPINLGTGGLTITATDLAMPGRLLDLVFTRSYNSDAAMAGSLGPGWTHSYEWKLTDNGSNVVLRRGDGREDAFTTNPDGSYADPPNVFDTVVKNGDGTFTLTLLSQVQYEFSASGQLTRIHEPAGNQVLFGYTSGDLTTITDTVGRVLALGHACACSRAPTTRGRSPTRTTRRATAPATPTATGAAPTSPTTAAATC